MAPFIGTILICTILIGVPIGYSLGISSIIFMKLEGISLQAFTHNLGLGMNSFPLLSVPFFILAGQLMNESGITRRIFDFAGCVIGPVRGGVGQVNILANLMFAGMSGSAVANAAGLGVIEIKAMRDAGYDNDFSVAVTAASSTMGPIIPPSIIMVIYGITAEVSIGHLFLAGVLPGLLMTVALMIYTYLIARRRNYPVGKSAGILTLLKSFISAVPALVTPLIIVGGIFGGIFTPTEAGAVAVLYALLLGLFVYKELKPGQIYRVFINTMLTTSLILFIVGAATTFGWVLTYFRIPLLLVEYVRPLSTNPLLIMLFFVGVYLFLGCFMEAAAIVIMTIPVVLPLILSVGIDPVHFGIVVSMCMAIGTLTPPVGLVAFIVCDIGEISLERYTRIILPYLAILLLVIIIVAILPDLVMFLPNLFS